jgi:DNA polymerase-1
MVYLDVAQGSSGAKAGLYGSNFRYGSAYFSSRGICEYKATRIKAPDDLYEQFNRVREVTEALSIPVFEQEGYEADDVIGALSKQISDKIETIIVTGDLDELQLVSKNVKVYTMRKGFTDTVIYDLEMVKERYGLTPTEFIDYKALKGDSSDNIPGVAGIGEKTACDLIQKYHTIENLYGNLSDLKGAVYNRLVEGKENAFLSKRLSKIETDIP